MAPTAIAPPTDQAPVDLKAKLRAEMAEGGQKEDVPQEDAEGDDDDGDEEVAADGATGGAYLVGFHLHVVVLTDACTSRRRQEEEEKEKAQEEEG
jgi:hypothetical protein